VVEVLGFGTTTAMGLRRLDVSLSVGFIIVTAIFIIWYILEVIAEKKGKGKK